MQLSFSLTQLNYIVAVDTHQHFAKAAAACFVSQPTLSMQIRKLETQLGVELFDRGRKPIEPTDIGRIVIQQARTVLREAAGIETLLQQMQANNQGSITLGVLPTLAPYIMPLVAGPFQQRYPNIFLRVQELTTHHIIAGIKADQLDAGIIATHEEGHKLSETPLFEETFVNFISPTHQLSQNSEIPRAALDLNDMWLLSDGHCFRDQVVNLCRTEPTTASSSQPRQPYFDCGYFDTLIRMVEEVDGLTLLPELAVLFLTDAQKQLLRPFVGGAPSRTVRLIRGQSYLKRPLIDAFVSTMLEQVAPHVRRVFPIENRNAIPQP